jgi:hypothetical protein
MTSGTCTIPRRRADTPLSGIGFRFRRSQISPLWEVDGEGMERNCALVIDVVEVEVFVVKKVNADPEGRTFDKGGVEGGWR